MIKRSLIGIAVAAFVIVASLIPAQAQQEAERDRAIALYREGEFTQAISVLEKVVATVPTDRAAWTYLGGSYANAGDKDRAAKAFRSSRVRATNPQPTYEKSVVVTYKPKARFPESGRARPGTTKVMVAVEFKADGTIGFAIPLDKVSREFIDSALESSRRIKFEPALAAGSPVTTIRMVEYGFSSGR